MMVRLLLLLNLAAVLAIVGKYLIELRDDPRVVAGWVMAPAALAMAASTLLTTVFHRRGLRHAWLFVGVLGSSACLWWLSGLDNFTAKEHTALVLACWGACIGLFPPVFLTDEVEGVSPKDMLYAGSLAAVGLIVPLLTMPTMTGTVIKAWSDRALDVYRANLSEDRPAVAESAARIADYYRQRGPRRGRAPARDVDRAGHVRRGRERRRGLSPGLPLPEPGGPGPRPDRRDLPVAGRPRPAGPARGGLFLIPDGPATDSVRRGPRAGAAAEVEEAGSGGRCRTAAARCDPPTTPAPAIP